MSWAQFQIGSVFQNIDYLYFQSGIYFSGNPMNGIRVIYWPHGRPREIASLRNSRFDGYVVRFHTNNGHPSTFLHYRNGEKYGEQQYWDSKGQSLRHILVDGDKVIPFNPIDAQDFSGYLRTQAQWDSYVEYERLGPGRRRK